MKPMPASLMQRVTPCGVNSMFTPSAASTSAAPERDERARLPAPRGVPDGGDVEKVQQHEMAVLGGNALRMKLNTVHRQRAMRQSHDETITGFRRDRKLGRQACPLDHERMVARCLERRDEAAEYAAALVQGRRQR